MLCRPVRYRNRAISVLSLLKGFSRSRIPEYLLIARKSVNRKCYGDTHSSLRHASIGLDKGKRRLKHDDPVYADKVFSILHSPPSSFGYNRTSWRQKDINKVLEASRYEPVDGRDKKHPQQVGLQVLQGKNRSHQQRPEIRRKAAGVREIFLANLGPKEKFFSIDEYGPFAVRLQGGVSLVPPGISKTVPQWQKSRGSIIVTAALELSTNQMSILTLERRIPPR